MIAEELQTLAAEAAGRAKKIAATVTPGIDASHFKAKSKVIFKAVSYREVFAHRFADIAVSAAEALEAQRPVSTATLTRSTLETMARTYELQVRLDAFVLNPDIEDLNQFLMNRMFGARKSRGELPPAVNVLNAVDKANEFIPLFRHNYDRLSEFTHPNYLGGMGVFAIVDRKRDYVSFTDKTRCQKELVAAAHILIGTLHGFVVFYDHVGGTIDIMDRLLLAETNG
jgi:hypothetical protein